MRLLLGLNSLKDCIYDISAFHKFQGFIYSLLRDTQFSMLHDSKGCKFFCFSNIFPIGDLRTGGSRKLLISSPSSNFIETLRKKLEAFKESKTPVNIGEYQFLLSSIQPLSPKLGKAARMITATPIVIRIPEGNYEQYGLSQEQMKPRYVYWRPEIPFDAFIKQLEDGIFKRYNAYHNTQIQSFPLFQSFIFKKSVANHLIHEGVERTVIGSVWEFHFDYLTGDQKKLLEFGIETGFGERNSYGFGFVNLV